jgi:isoquinoline 1-oxidoreductase beta subunit
VRIARELSPSPVQLVWSREQDLTHDYYRPAVLARMRGVLGADGRPRTWTARYTDSIQRSADTPRYAIPRIDVEQSVAKSHLRTGYWRSVDHSQQGFFIESFVDELAHAAGADPFEYRRGLLADAPRDRAVLERAAALANWGSAVAPGRGRGIAVVEGYGSVVAVVIEVETGADVPLRVTHVWAAVDCGPVINPETAHGQVEGGVLFGLSAALGEAITLEQGRVVQQNFHDYELLRLRDAPPVTVEFLRSEHAPGGLGEPGLPPVAPALANAYFAATGRRVRRLPLLAALRS